MLNVKCPLMVFSGIQKFTMLDFPGHIACIVFTPGCNFRCGYCHNPEFVLPEQMCKIANSFIPENKIHAFLDQRRNLLEGVVISGGEPTIHRDLIPFMRKVKNMGFLVKLDTNGNKPEVIKQALDENLLDYIAMDIKTSLDNYQELCGKGALPEKIEESINLIKSCGVEYEFRTTMIKEIHTKEILEKMKPLIANAKNYRINQFRPGKTLDPKFAGYSPCE